MKNSGSQQLTFRNFLLEKQAKITIFSDKKFSRNIVYLQNK